MLQSHKNAMFNVPNLLTLSRLALVPVFIYFLSLNAPWAVPACVATGLAIALSDILDGYAGRKLNQVTDLGKALDPAVDKVTGVAMLVGLYFFRGLPLAFVVFKLCKEFLMLVRSIVVLKKWSNIPSANVWGKAACIALFSSMIPFVVDVMPKIRTYLLWAVAAAECAALISYYVELFRGEGISRVISDEPSGGP